VVARAQQSAIPVIGFLNGQTPAEWAAPVAAFRQGLTDAGFLEGRNVMVEFRWAEGQYDRLPALAADLVRRKVAVVVPLRSRKGLPNWVGPKAAMCGWTFVGAALT
jgi:putative tryptophan/tyrosine transport system substrate-binding protein